MELNLHLCNTSSTTPILTSNCLPSYLLTMLSVLGREMSSTISTVMPVMVNKTLPAVGYRFYPTDVELLTHFLKYKNLGHESQVRAINVVNVCKCEPWDLPGQSKIRSKDQVWYFFCPRDLKYSNSKRLNRTTEAGYWKPTGKPRKVTAKRTKKQIGTKRTLVFYIGHPKGTRTKWVMHEYDFNLPNQGNYVVCKLLKKPCEKTMNHDVALASDVETGVANSFSDKQQSAFQEAPNVENECQSEVPGTPCGDVVSSPTVTPSILHSQIFFSGETTTPPPSPPPTAIPSIFEKQISVTMIPVGLQEQMAVPVTPSNLKNQISFTITSSLNIKDTISMTSSNLIDQILSCDEAIPHPTKPSNHKDQIFFCTEATPHATKPFNIENKIPNNIENHMLVVGDLCEQGDCVFIPDFHIQNLAYGGDELTPMTMADELTPMTMSDELTPTTMSDELTPRTTMSDELTPVTTMSDELTPVTTMSAELTPVTTMSDELTPMTTMSDELTPMTMSFDQRDELHHQKGNYLSTSSVENQRSDFDFEGGKWITAIAGPSDTNRQLLLEESISLIPSNLEHQLPHNDLLKSFSGPTSFRNEQELDIVEPNCPMEHDFRELNSEEKVNTEDSESGSPEPTISDFKTHSTYEKTIVSTPEQFEWSSLAPIDLVSRTEFDTLLEENWVTDPECMFGSEHQWLMSAEVSPWAQYSGFGNSMPGSYDLVHVPSFSLPA